MATPVYPPTITTNILVNTRTQPKIVYLPAVSTIGSGKLYFIKDICGNASQSSIYLSTTGLDSFDYKFRPSTLCAFMSTNFQSVLLASDGILNWLVLQNYNANLIERNINIVTTNLVYYLDAGNRSSYPGSGSTWTDLMGSGKNITLYNSPAYSSANGGYLTFLPASSQYGESLSSFPTYTRFTLEVWHYYTGTNTGTYPCIVTEIYPGTTSQINYLLYGYPTTTAVYVAFFNGAFQSSGSWTPTANNWYHIVGTYDGANLQLYINGTLTVTTANTATPASSTAGFRLMRCWDTNTYYWGGRLAVYRLYNRALSASEVSQNFNASRTRFGL